MQNKLAPSVRKVNVRKSAEETRKSEIKSDPGVRERSQENLPADTSPGNTLNPLKQLPGISFSLLFRFLLVAKIYPGRMTLFCRKSYGLETNLMFVLTAASADHFQQGVLAKSLGINENAMVFLVNKLQQLRLIKRVPNPDNRRERLIICTPKGQDIVSEVKSRYSEIVRWGLFPLTDSEIEQFGSLLARIIEGEALPKPPMPLIPMRRAKSATPGNGQS